MNDLWGKVPNHFLQIRDAYEGIEIGEGTSSWQFDRVVLDIPEPWQVVPHAARALRIGGIYLSYVPTVPQVMQTVQALEESKVFTLVQNFETLLRTWNVKGRSVACARSPDGCSLRVYYGRKKSRFADVACWVV